MRARTSVQKVFHHGRDQAHHLRKILMQGCVAVQVADKGGVAKFSQALGTTAG